MSSIASSRFYNPFGSLPQSVKAQPPLADGNMQLKPAVLTFGNASSLADKKEEGRVSFARLSPQVTEAISEKKSAGLVKNWRLEPFWHYGMYNSGVIVYVTPRAHSDLFLEAQPIVKPGSSERRRVFHEPAFKREEIIDVDGTKFKFILDVMDSDKELPDGYLQGLEKFVKDFLKLFPGKLEDETRQHYEKFRPGKQMLWLTFRVSSRTPEEVCCYTRKALPFLMSGTENPASPCTNCKLGPEVAQALDEEYIEPEKLAG